MLSRTGLTTGFVLAYLVMATPLSENVFRDPDRRETRMSILEQIEQRASALKVNELAEILRVTPQHLYRLASDGLIPCFRIAGAIRFDPHDVAEWLRSRQPKMVRSRRLRVA